MARHRQHFIGVEQVNDPACPRRKIVGAVGQGLGGGGGVEDHEDFLGAQPARIGEQPGTVRIIPLVDVGAGEQRGIEPAEVVQLGDHLELRVRHVEVVAQRGSLLELAVEHVFPVVGIGGAVEGLLGAVVEARDAARRCRGRPAPH